MENKNHIILIEFMLIVIFMVAMISSMDIAKVENQNEINVCNLNYTLNSSCREFQKESYIKELNLSKNNLRFDDDLLNKMIERDKADNKNLKNIIAISKLIDERSRTKSVNELLFINKGFIEKFSRYSQIDDRNKENTKIQLNDYINEVESKNKFKFDFKFNKIIKLFSDNDTKSFVDSLREIS